MTKEKAMSKASGFFKKDSSLKELHFTSDGQAFPKLNNAQVHGKELGKGRDEVISVKREELELDVAPVGDTATGSEGGKKDSGEGEE